MTRQPERRLKFDMLESWSSLPGRRSLLLDPAFLHICFDILWAESNGAPAISNAMNGEFPGLSQLVDKACRDAQLIRYCCDGQQFRCRFFVLIFHESVLLTERQNSRRSTWLP